jgi:hypothetical protein
MSGKLSQHHGVLAMPQGAEKIVDLLDTQQRLIGRMRIERREEDLLVGTFVPGPGFPGVEPLFRAFEEAADLQALHVIDELDAAIAALGVAPTLARCTRAHGHPGRAN